MSIITENDMVTCFDMDMIYRTIAALAWQKNTKGFIHSDGRLLLLVIFVFFVFFKHYAQEF